MLAARTDSGRVVGLWVVIAIAPGWWAIRNYPRGPLRKQVSLNLGNFHRGGTLFVVVNRVVDPRSDRGSYAAAVFCIAFMKPPIDCVNCASTSSAMVMTSGNSKLKSRELVLSCNVRKSVTWSIRDSCTSISGL
jgi:hypothetical protein